MSDLRDRLDPEYASAYDHFPRFELADLGHARQAAWERLVAVAPSEHRAIETHECEIDSPGGALRVRHHRPAGAGGTDLPAIVWVHGGGHVMGFPEADDAFLARTVATIPCHAFAVRWRWSPEAPFPAELDDCEAALRWVAANADALAVDRRRVALAGSSSGGGTAAGLALRLRDLDDPIVNSLLLIQPMLDDRGAAAEDSLTGRLWSAKSNVAAWRAYLGDSYGTDRVSCEAAPARASAELLGGLPPTWIWAGELDLFCDEDVEFGRRLSRAGVRTELQVYGGAIHGFHALLPESRLAHRFAADWISAVSRAFGVEVGR